MDKKRFLRFLLTGIAEDEIDWVKHDNRYHFGAYDPKTMHCETRHMLETGDLADTLMAEELEKITNPNLFDWTPTMNAADWGDLTKTKPIVGNGSPVVVESGTKAEFKDAVIAASQANIRSQRNYIGESRQNQPQMILDGKVYRFTKGVANHGMNIRHYFENGNAAAMIGDLLNNSVIVPNAPFGITYRMAAFDIGEKYYALITAFRSPDYKDISDVVDVEILHAVNAKRGDDIASSSAASGSTATPGFSPSPTSQVAVSISNFRDAWQRQFLDGIKKLFQDKRHMKSDR